MSCLVAGKPKKFRQERGPRFQVTQGFRSEGCRPPSILFAENGTFVTPQGAFPQGRVAMVKDFGPEAQQAVTAATQAAFSNYKIRFIKPDVAVADALITVRNVNGPDGTVIPVIPINFFTWPPARAING